MDPSDRQLLERFVTARDESAFRLLVQRHLPLVHGVARRVTASEDLARDVAQDTFIRLARRAAMIPPGVNLGAWLHRVARHAAIDLMRAEMRRKKREQATSPIHPAMTTSTDDGAAWEALAPVVDELVDALPAADRDLLVARFYLNESHATIAGRMGLSEVLARKRTSRALEKLRVLLGKRGIATSSSALAMLLPAHAAAPAPATLMTTVVSATQGVTPLVPSGLHAATLAMNATQKTLIATAALIFLGSLGSAIESHLRPVPAAAAAVSSATAENADSAARRERARPAPATAGERLVRLKEILAIDNLVTRRREMIGFLDSLAPPHFREAADYLTRPDHSYAEEQEYAVLLSAWAKADVHSALGYLNPADLRGGPNFRTVLQTWGGLDPQAAINWTKAYPPASRVNWRLATALAGLAATDPAAAFREIREIPDPALRADTLKELQDSMDRYQPASTERLLAQTDDAATRTQLVVAMTESPFLSNTARAAHLLAMDQGAQEQVDASAMFANWRPWNPAISLDFIAALPSGKMRNEAAGSTIMRMAVAGDPVLALKAAATYPDAMTDKVIDQVTTRAVQQDVRGSIALALQMKDESARLQTLARLATKSGNDFPTDGARLDWLEKAGVPAGLREQVPAQPLPEPPPSPPHFPGS